MLSEAKKEILSRFGGYMSGTETLELEAKFGTIRDIQGRPSFVNEVPYIYFNRLRSKMSESIKPLKPILTKTRDQISSDNVRKTTSEDDTVSFIRKNRVMEDIDSLDFGVRLSLSSEDTLPEAPEGWTGDVLRVKTRWSFPFQNGKYRLDLTHVDQTNFRDNETTNRFEIELELVDQGAIDDFFWKLNQIFQLIYGTEEIWTFPERDKLIQYTNKLLGGNVESKTIDISRIRQARNLRWDDLVFGGIVGNSGEDYVIYHKVDGVRKLIVCSPWGVWIIYPQYEFNKLTNTSPQKAIGSILFVEEVPVENRKKSAPEAKHWAIVFDCVAFSDQSYNLRNLEERTRASQDVTNMLKEQFEEKLLAIGTSRYRIIRSPEEFFSHCREFIKQQENSKTELGAQRGETGGGETGGVLAYETDGLIFAPFKAPAQHGSDKLPLSERVLTMYPDSCKWKPQHLITNDLAIRWIISDEGVRTMDVETYIYEERLFTEAGTVSDKIWALSSIPSGSVVKFKWDFNHNRLHVVGRADRPEPLTTKEARNRLRKAKSPNTDDKERRRIALFFRIIRKGNIELYTRDRISVPFRGTDEYPFDPKNIKKNPKLDIEDFPIGAVFEFQATPDGGILPLKYRQDKTLPNELDIVLDNWNLAKNPISKETLLGETFDLLDRYKERCLISLLNSLPNYNNVLLIGKLPRRALPVSKFANFRASEDIPEDVSGVTSVLFYQSLSRMESNNQLQRIFDAIPVTGSLVYLDIDGDAVRHLFFPEIKGPSPDESGYTIGPINLKWQDGIIIEGLVSKQVESLNVISLFNFLEPTGPFQINIAFRLDNERLMHQAEKFFGDLHSAIILTRISQEYKIVPMQRAKITAKKPEVVIHPDEKIDDPKLGADEKAVVLAVENNHLPMLSVIIPMTSSYGRTYIPHGVVAQGDDTYEPVACTWYPGNVVRIATIGGGSCFFHAVLKAYDPVYQENNEAAFRIDLVTKLRRDLAALLGFGNPEDPEERTYYELAVGGRFVELAEQQRKNPGLIRTMKVDFSLEGLQALFNSIEDVGEEVYKFVSDMLGVDIYVLRGTTRDLFPHSNTSTIGQLKRSVIIMGNTNHYEVIGVDTPEGFQTMFPSDHAFLSALRRMNPHGDEGGFK